VWVPSWRQNGGEFQACTDIGAAIEPAAGNVDDGASRKWVGELSGNLDRAQSVPPT
jgi:hypothetical protein